jgi:glutaredoxin
MSSQTLELYYFDECPYCQRVLKAMDEMKISLTLKNTRTDSKNREFHLKTTGKTQVPCLYIDGKPMFESMDIINWLKANQANITKIS